MTTYKSSEWFTYTVSIIMKKKISSSQAPREVRSPSITLLYRRLNRLTGHRGSLAVLKKNHRPS